MKEHLVRRIKKYGHITVANAMYFMGYRWTPTASRPTNVERMVQGMPHIKLTQLLNTLESRDIPRLL